ncbi:hypothetical protein Noda2021_06080 [Candidatus Dependentiae bacterium Noda2021]|nr:hypothetical protein Noda2021_06080 [Candidatus Dependentiae bacterium Noda2021]
MKIFKLALVVITCAPAIMLDACETQPLRFILARVKNSTTQTYSLAELKTTPGTKPPFLTIQPQEELSNITVPVDHKGRAQFVILDTNSVPRYAIAFTPNAADDNVHVQMREVGKKGYIQDAYFTPSDIAVFRQEALQRGACYKGIAINLDLGGQPQLKNHIPQTITYTK